MEKVSRLLACSLTLIMAASISSYAWNSRGHMMVAAVAYGRLTPAVKARVDALLLLNPDRDNWLDLIPANTSAANKKKMLFVIAATFPDRIKSNPDFHTDGPHNGNRPPNDPSASQNIGYDDLARHKYWHFVDTPFGTGTMPPVPTPNAKDRIELFISTLGSTASDDVKSYDLCWLLHLVGDVHQPLHCVTRVNAATPDGDDGGNGVKLTSPANLHTFWDDLLGTGSSVSTAISAAVLLTNAPSGSANDLNVQHWLDESVNAAQADAYKKPTIGDGVGPFTITAAYKAKATKIAQQRVALAGAPLAKILNEKLK